METTIFRCYVSFRGVNGFKPNQDLAFLGSNAHASPAAAAIFPWDMFATLPWESVCGTGIFFLVPEKSSGHTIARLTDPLVVERCLFHSIRAKSFSKIFPPFLNASNCVLVFLLGSESIYLLFDFGGGFFGLKWGSHFSEKSFARQNNWRKAKG